MDREGRIESASSLQRPYFGRPLFSPDGARIAVAAYVDVDAWGTFVLDVASGAWSRVGGEGDLQAGAWMPDGKQLLLIGSSAEDLGLLLAPIAGNETPRMLSHGEFGTLAVSPDGTTLLFRRQGRPGDWDIWRMSLAGDERIEPWLATSEGAESSATFSPDGRFVAYQSDESGRDEIYVRAYPGGESKYQVSTQGGVVPRWSHDGREIFFLDGRAIWSAAVHTAPTFASEPPRRLFVLSDEAMGGFDPSPDGKRFVMGEKDPIELRPLDLVIIPGWVEEMKSRLAAAKSN